MIIKVDVIDVMEQVYNRKPRLVRKIMWEGAGGLNRDVRKYLTRQERKRLTKSLAQNVNAHITREAFLKMKLDQTMEVIAYYVPSLDNALNAFKKL